MAEASVQDGIVEQDLGIDGADVNDLGLIGAVSQSEIEDLLFSDSRPVEERLARLSEIRGQLEARQVSEIGDDDSASLLVEVIRAIDELGGSLSEREDEPEAYAPLDPAVMVDPTDHIETLSPDDDGRYAVEGEDDEDGIFVTEDDALGEDADEMPDDDDLDEDDLLDSEDDDDEDEDEDDGTVPH